MNVSGNKKNRCRFMVGGQRQRFKGSDTVLPYPTPNKHFILSRSKLSILAAWSFSCHPWREPEWRRSAEKSPVHRLLRSIGGVATASQIKSKPLGETRQAQGFASKFIVGWSNTICPLGIGAGSKIVKVLDGQIKDLQCILSLSKVLAYRRTYCGFAILSELLRSFYGVFLGCFCEFSGIRRNPSGIYFSYSNYEILEV